MSEATDALLQRRLTEAAKACETPKTAHLLSLHAHDALAQLKAVGVTFTEAEIDTLVSWIGKAAKFMDRHHRYVEGRDDARVIAEACRTILKRLPLAGAFGELQTMPGSHLSLQQARDVVEAIEEAYAQLVAEIPKPKRGSVGKRLVAPTRNVYWLHLLGFWLSAGREPRAFVRKSGEVGGSLGHFLREMSREATSHPDIDDNAIGAEAIKAFVGRAKREGQLDVSVDLSRIISDEDFAKLANSWAIRSYL